MEPQQVVVDADLDNSESNKDPSDDSAQNESDLDIESNEVSSDDSAQNKSEAEQNDIENDPEASAQNEFEAEQNDEESEATNDSDSEEEYDESPTTTNTTQENEENSTDDEPVGFIGKFGNDWWVVDKELDWVEITKEIDSRILEVGAQMVEENNIEKLRELGDDLGISYKTIEDMDRNQLRAEAKNGRMEEYGVNGNSTNDKIKKALILKQILSISKESDKESDKEPTTEELGQQSAEVIKSEDEMSDLEYEAYTDEEYGEWAEKDFSSDTGSYMSD